MNHHRQDASSKTQFETRRMEDTVARIFCRLNRQFGRTISAAFLISFVGILGSCSGGGGGDVSTPQSPAPSPPPPPAPSPPPPPANPNANSLRYSSAVAITGPRVIPRGVDIGPDGAVISVGSFDAGGNMQVGNLSITSGDGQSDIYVLVQQANGAPTRLTAFGGGGGSDFAADVAIAGDGSSYIVGAASGSARFGNLTFATGSPANSDAFVVKLSATGTPEWTLRGAGASSALGNEIELASNGDLLVTGTFQQDLDFGQGVRITSSAGAGVDQAYVLRVSPSGQPLWARAITGPVRIGGRGVAGDPVSLEGDNNRRVLLAVQFDGGSATLETPTGNLRVTGAGGGDCMVVALSADGGPLFAQAFGSAGADNCRGIGATFNGDAFVAGEFTGAVTFGSRQLTSRGGEDIYVIRLDRNGVVQSAVSVGGQGDDGGPEIEVEENGRAFFTGSFAGAATASSGAVFNSGGAPREVFIAEVSTDGANLSFAEPSPGTGDDVAFALARGPNETAAVVGTFTGSLQFGATTLSLNGQAGAFVAIASPQATPPPQVGQNFILAGPVSFAQSRFRDDGSVQAVNVPVFLYAPLNPGRYPLIVWSHGAISSPQNIELMQVLASEGFIVAAIAHADSAEQRANPASSGLAGTGNPYGLVNRAADGSMVLDRISNLQAALPAGYVIDVSRPTIGGHSLGALTSMELSGADWALTPSGAATVTTDDTFNAQVIADQTVPDARFVAGLFVSPAGTEQSYGLNNFNKVDIPFLAITGTRDTGPPNNPFPSGFIDRRDVFSSTANDGIGADDGVNDDGQYFIVFNNATHFDFLGNNNTYDAEVREIVLRFLNGVIRNNPDAIAPLNTPSQYRANRPLIQDFLARPYVP